jgi:hypothetical protein
VSAATRERARDDWLRIPYPDRLNMVREGLARLHASIAEQCPGEHRFVDHGDENPPWCDACGHCDNTLPLSGYGHGKGKHRQRWGHEQRED